MDSVVNGRNGSIIVCIHEQCDGCLAADARYDILAAGLPPRCMEPQAFPAVGSVIQSLRPQTTGYGIQRPHIGGLRSKGTLRTLRTLTGPGQSQFFHRSFISYVKLQRNAI